MNATTRKDYFWNTLGVLLQSAISPILLIIVARLNGIEAVGVFSFAFAVSLLLWMLAIWGGRTYQVSDTQSEFEHRSYMMVRILLAVTVTVIAVIFCLINQYDTFKVLLIITLVIFKLIESFSDVLYGVLQVHKKLYLSGISLTIKALLGITIFVILDILTKNILVSTFGIVLINIFIYISCDLRWVNRLESVHFPLRKAYLYLKEAREIIKRCSGVFIIFFLAMFSLNIPRYFIDIYKAEEVGYFGIIAMPITLIVLAVSFILQPNILNITKLYRAGKINDFRKAVNRILFTSLSIGLAILLAAYVIGVDILGVVFDINFSQYQAALTVIVVGGIASATVTAYLNIFVIMRKIHFSLFVLIATNCVLIPASYIMVQKEGLIGGVSAFAVTNLIQLVLVAIYFRNCVKNYAKN